ncbi:patatin-like phospholipase family protein [archaeon]|nr:patatin-like phospholipase family protein [archaeon]
MKLRPLKKIGKWLGKKEKPKLKVGLALGSGGIFGLAHIGVLKVLKENNIPIDFIAGTSMGSLVGAYYALTSIEELERKATSLTKKDLVRLIDITFPKNSLISGNRIKKFIKETFQDSSFKDMKVPLKIVTTDLESGKEFIIEKGKLADAIMVSISIPGIFPPIRLNGKLLADGAIINPTPTDIVKKMGADVVIGVDLTVTNKVEIKNPNIFKTLMRSYDILRTQSVKFNVSEEDEKVLIIRPKIPHYNSSKSYEIQKIIGEGERIAKESLPQIKRLLKKKIQN